MGSGIVVGTPDEAKSCACIKGKVIHAVQEHTVTLQVHEEDRNANDIRAVTT